MPLMLSRNIMKLGALGMAFLLWGACSDDRQVDDDDDDGGQGGSVTSFVGSASSGMGGRSGTTSSSMASSSTGMGSECVTACTTLYQCGAANMGELCPAFVAGGVDEMTFLDGPNGNDGCVATCDGNPLLTSLVNPNDCESTIANLKAASSDFAASCDGTAGGAGGNQ